VEEYVVADPFLNPGEIRGFFLLYLFVFAVPLFLYL
jgi:hypothetical protein